MSESIRVFIIDDHDMVRDSFQQVIDAEADMDVVGTASCLAEARAAVPEAHPDVIVSDYLLPDGTGAEVCAASRDEAQPPKVIVITGADDRQAVEAAVRTGCSGFISKGRGVQDLLRSIRAVAGGAAVFPADLLAAMTRGDDIAAESSLTKRELEILEMLGTAKNADEIASDLYLSVHTVRNHIRAILTKLEARSQLEALVIGVRKGLVHIPTELS